MNADKMTNSAATAATTGIKKFPDMKTFIFFRIFEALLAPLFPALCLQGQKRR